MPGSVGHSPRAGSWWSSPDYRLVPQVRFPAFLQDGAEAVKFVVRIAENVGGGPDADRPRRPFRGGL